MNWTAWPMIRSPLRAVLAVAFVVLMAWTLQSILHAGYFTLLAVLLVWGQIAGFFLPTRYRLTDETVEVRGLVGRKTKGWSDFRTWYVDKEGVLLSPFLERSRLERFRGLSLQFHDNRDEVVAFVERAMKEVGVSDEHVGDEGHDGREGDDGRAA